MEQKTLDEIRARCEAATGEPWIRQNSHIFSCLGTGDLLKIGGGFDINDAEFIAHAREDIPALLDEIATFYGKIDAIWDMYKSAEAEVTALKERLKKAVT